MPKDTTNDGTITSFFAKKPGTGERPTKKAPPEPEASKPVKPVALQLQALSEATLANLEQQTMGETWYSALSAEFKKSYFADVSVMFQVRTTSSCDHS